MDEGTQAPWWSLVYLHLVCHSLLPVPSTSIQEPLSALPDTYFEMNSDKFTFLPFLLFQRCLLPMVFSAPRGPEFHKAPQLAHHFMWPCEDTALPALYPLRGCTGSGNSGRVWDPVTTHGVESATHSY